MEDVVKKVLTEQLDISADQVKSEAHLINDLGADSLDIVELVMALEEELDVVIPDDDADGLETVGQIVDYLESL
jgi:acyl carrier protein|tara:strand:- start:2106 stop:2327 length:222 start_codon:yes stop_codon:yes gene_type:complete